MKVHSLTAILIILSAAFVVSFLISRYVALGPNGPFIRENPLTGSIGPSGCSIGIDCPTLSVSANPKSIYIHVANAGLVESTVLTVTEPGTTCDANTQIIFQSDKPGTFSSPSCYLQGGGCSCSVTFQSGNTLGTATFVATDVTHAASITPGGTSVEIKWSETPCVGTAASCGSFLSQSSCTQQTNCQWVNPTSTFQNAYCSGPSGCQSYTTQDSCNQAQIRVPRTPPSYAVVGAVVGDGYGGYDVYYCSWNLGDIVLYPMCAGTVSYDCSQVISVSSCAADFRCQWDTTTNRCAKKPCSTWNANQNNCNLAQGCVYATTPCAGSATTCSSINDKNVCGQQSGCAWAGFSPLNPPCHSTQGTSYFTSTPCASLTSGASCSNQASCTWSDKTSLCTGTTNATTFCNGLSTLVSCTNNYQCFYNFTSNTCQAKPCSTWNGDQSKCVSSNNCTYNQVFTCSGNSAKCDSFYNNQIACQSQNGCQWYSTTPSSITTTSTTSTTSSTTTTTVQPTFSYSNFACSAVTAGFSCGFNYVNNLGENAVIVFLFTNPNGDVVQSPAPIASQGSGTASSLLYCSSVSSGRYYVAWKAYRMSDISLTNAVNWSKSNERQVINC